MAYSEILQPGDAEENYEKLQLGHPIYRQRFYPGTSRI
jgi:hypothetical protein